MIHQFIVKMISDLAVAKIYASSKAENTNSHSNTVEDIGIFHLQIIKQCIDIG